MPVETHEDIVLARGMEADGVSTHHDIKLAHGVEAANERVERAYGGVVPGPKFDKDEPEQYGRRLIEWAFAAAPIVARGHTPSFAGQWKYSNIHMRNEGGRVGPPEARMDEEVKAGNPDYSVYNSSQHLSSDGDRYRSPSDDFDIEEIKNRAGKYYGGGMGGFKGFSPGFKGSRSRFTTSPMPQQPNEINMQESANRTETGLLRPPVDPAVSRGSIPRLPDYVQGFSGGYPTASPQQPLPTGRPSGYPTGGIFDVWGPMFASAMGSFYSGLGGGYRGFADGGAVDDEEQRQLTPMGFYSAAAEAAGRIPQRAPIDQILNKVKGSPGVKAEELDWSGVKDAFAGQGSVDPQEVARHLQANLPQLQETVKGSPIALAERMHRERQSLLVQGRVDEANALRDQITQTYNPSWRRANAAQYDDYTLPGGENYREVLLHLPEKNENYKSSHWSTPNVVAHLRLSDRDRGRTLHMEELQSDWGQEGRDTGFDKRKGLNADEQRELNQLISVPMRERTNDQMNRFNELINQRDFQSIPSAPHVTSTEGWTDLGLKRALQEAAKGGYKKLVWTPGQDQAERYDLSNTVKHIMWSPDNKLLSALTHEGSETIGQKVEKEDLHKYIGKEAASKLLEQEPEVFAGMATHHLRGQEISVGGEGMKNYYDRFLPKRLEKLVSKLDPEAKVRLYGHKIDIPGENYPSDANDWKGDEDDWDFKKVHSIEITPKLRAAILKGLPAYEQGGTVLNHGLDVVSRLPR